MSMDDYEICQSCEKNDVEEEIYVCKFCKAELCEKCLSKHITSTHLSQVAEELSAVMFP